MDVFARNMLPKVVSLAQSMSRELSKDDQVHLKAAL